MTNVTSAAVAALIVTLASASLGCGGAAPQAQVSSPFTQEHARYFEGGIDFVDDPTTLTGRWREEWLAELDTRIEHSDAVAKVSVETVRTAWDLDRRKLQLELTVSSVLHGVLPMGNLTVSSQEGEPGYPSVKSNEARLLHATYILFVKWSKDEDGQLIPHWHLSPDSEQVTSTVQSRLEMRAGNAR